METPAAGPPRDVSRALERIALIVLVLLATSNRPLGRVAGLTVRSDWICGLLAVGVVLVAVAARRRLPSSPALLLFSAFVAVQLLSSALNRGAWPQGLRFSLLYVFALATICAVLVLVRDLETARWTLSVIVIVTVAEAVISVLSVLASSFSGLPEPSPARRRLLLRAEGLMSEANLFASLLLVPFAVALWRWSAVPRPAPLHGAACLALSAALVFSLTRMAWIMSLAVVWLSPLRRTMESRRLRRLAVGVIVAAAVLLGADLLARRGVLQHTGFYDRLVTGLATGYDEPLDARREEFRAGFAGWRESPWLGHGAGSGKALKQRYRDTRHLRPRPWLSNATLFVLHDSGVVGLTLLAAALVAAGRQWRRARDGFGEPAAALDHAALGIGLAATLVAWQVTHGLWQTYGYLYLGLLLAMSRLAAGPPAASR